DYTVGSVWLKMQDNHYLIDMFCARVLFPELVREVENLNDRYNPTMNIIEDKASGIALIQQLREKHPNMNIRPYNPGKMDKSQRVDIATPAIEAGHVFLPAQSMNGVLIPTAIARDVIENLAEFPLGEHDDITDSVAMYLNYHRTRYELYLC
ncbi:MAG: phage terminase large subunit, partial [Candidatus Methanomethylophilaceae archaeon]